MVTGAKLKAWRVAQGLSQADAARLAGVSRATVNRSESGAGEVGEALAALVTQGPGAVPVKEAVKASFAAPPKAPKVKATPSALAEAMKRKPLYATTAEEAHAMRDELHRLAGGEAVCGRASLPLIPLQPVWVTVDAMSPVRPGKIMYRFPCNAAIPQPRARALDYSPRAVLSHDGALYDFETAQRLRSARARAA